MFLLRNKKKLSLNYPQYPLLSGALKLEIKVKSSQKKNKIQKL